MGGQLANVSQDGNTRKVKKALVFILVYIYGGFKTLVAYYLVNSLQGKVKAILMTDLLKKLHEKNIFVPNITLDGDKSNQKSCKVYIYYIKK